jgi:hypothetical protein
LMGDGVAETVGKDWEQIIACMPGEIDLEATARQTKALQRRREIKSGADLLRMVLAYAICDWSFRMVGIWCSIIGVGNLSDVAVLKRLRHCQAWLGKLIYRILDLQRLQVVHQPGVRLRIMDGTGVSKPGSTGTDWRIHLSLDLGHLCVDGVEVTDAKRGETFGHCPTQAGDIRMGDRGYAFSDSMGVVLADGGGLVVRINWQSVPLQTSDGQKVDLIAGLRGLNGASSDQEVWFNTPQGCFALRLILSALPQAAADKARHRIRKMYRKKGKTPDERTLLAAGFVMLVTNLSAIEWPASKILQLYRVRWQIELLIKRLKSILNLDHLRTLDRQLSQVYLLGKLLAVLLIDELIHQTQMHCPTWFTSVERPLNLWRLTILFFEQLRQGVQGHITLAMIFNVLPHLARFLCNAPRKRLSQLAQARVILLNLSRC